MMKKKIGFWFYPLLLMGCIFIFVSGCKDDEVSPSNKLTDIDGNVYDTIVIGTQVWMVQNLKTTKYNDGTSIPLVTDETAWSNLTTPGYCFYDNDAAANKATYGALYNWYAVNTGKLCPKGWHVPSDAEWTILINYLGGENVAGGKLKESGLSHWVTPNDGATNSSGFKALPAGYRQEEGGFANINDDEFWWSTTTSDEQIIKAWTRGVNYNYPYVYNDFYFKSYGYSVRCIRN